MTSTTAIDPRQLRDVLGAFVTGVTVVTTSDSDGKLYGVTANSFSSVSLNPPLVLWSQSLTSRSHPAFVESQSFVVNILADDQIAVSNQFAKSTDDKFRDLEFSAGVGGCPVLGGAAATLECTKVAEYPGGDHVVFLGRVERMHRSNKRPLAFGSGRYMVAYSHDLGPVSLGLGSSTPRQLEAIRMATAALPAICEAAGDHTACLGVWGNHGPTIVYWEPSRNPVSEHLRTGLVVSPTRSAVGRAFSAWLPPEVTKPFVEEDLRLFRMEGESAEEQKKRLEHDLAEFRERGLARTADINSPLHQRATNAFCAPIRDETGNAILALAITSAADRLPPDWNGAAPQALKRAAAELSARLGFRA
jgi:flavin reductase (DIM6/NTAB) family NADH-FMN oxidoreductase RutF/DNA-binding IclR family transcriptional regulator